MLVVCDYDGTLTGLVSPTPTGTVGWGRIARGARAALGRLAHVAQRDDDRVTVVILSGRRAGDLARRIRLPQIIYLGNHGLERVDGVPPASGEGRRAVDDVKLAPETQQLVQRVAIRLGAPTWLITEAKGQVVALHWRSAPDASSAGIRTLDALRAEQQRTPRDQHVLLEGRMAVEIRPANAPEKRDAVVGLLTTYRPSAVVMIGDDLTDASAFDVLRAARAEGKIMTLECVGVDSGPDTPLLLRSSSDHLVSGPAAVGRLLSELATRLEARQGATRRPPQSAMGDGQLPEVDRVIPRHGGTARLTRELRSGTPPMKGSGSL